MGTGTAPVPISLKPPATESVIAKANTVAAV
jgi:hypothetical protein